MEPKPDKSNGNFINSFIQAIAALGSWYILSVLIIDGNQPPEWLWALTLGAVAVWNVSRSNKIKKLANPCTIEAIVRPSLWLSGLVVMYLAYLANVNMPVLYQSAVAGMSAYWIYDHKNTILFNGTAK